MSPYQIFSLLNFSKNIMFKTPDYHISDTAVDIERV